MGRNRPLSPSRVQASPPRRSPSRRDRERSPGHLRSSRKASPPPMDKHSTRTKSPKQRNSASRSPSPRTKRLRRAESERDTEKKYEREHDRNGSRKSHDGGAHKERERGSTRESEVERRERRSEREETNGKSSRSRGERSESPRHRRSRHRSRSPAEGRAREEMENTRQDADPDGEIDSVSKMEAAEKALEQKQKQKPSFELSGKLADETNRVKGVTLLFNEPPDARKPDVRWRLYVFKAGEVLNEPLYIHRQSVYLFGRERRVADIPTDHPSCSKQHAVIQFRQVEKEQPNGMMKKLVLPYLMDLGSTNKTFLNENPIEPQRYYELFEKDTIKFGNSSREYVLLHENSAT